MYRPVSWLAAASLLGLSTAVCPFADGNVDPAALRARQNAQDPPAVTSNSQFIGQFAVDDTGAMLTTDAGGPIVDQASLRAGPRGPTLLEDFVLRQKIMHFDHERVGGHHNVANIAYYRRITDCCCCLIRDRFLSEPFMLVVLAHMEHSLRTETGATSPRHRSSAPLESRPPCLCAFPPWLVQEAAPTWQEMSTVLLLASTRTKATLILSATTCPSSSSRMRSNFLTWFMLSSRAQTMRFLRLPPLTIPRGTSSALSQAHCTLCFGPCLDSVLCEAIVTWCVCWNL